MSQPQLASRMCYLLTHASFTFLLSCPDTSAAYFRITWPTRVGRNTCVVRTHTRVVASVVLLCRRKFQISRATRRRQGGGGGKGGLLEAVERGREHLRVHVSQREEEEERRKGLERRNTAATTLSVGSRWAGEQQVVA